VNHPSPCFAVRGFISISISLDGVTSVHQHSFCGAFQVFLGSSIHSQFNFEENQTINPTFHRQIILREVELLSEGDIRRIMPGSQYIHSLFHLDRPSATVIIRTYKTPDRQPQYEYHRHALRWILSLIGGHLSRECKSRHFF
jgi:hypothetical protein